MNPLTVIDLITSAAGVLGKADGAAPVTAIIDVMKKLNDTGLIKLPKAFANAGELDRAVSGAVTEITSWLPWLRDKVGLPAGGLDKALADAIKSICLGSPSGVAAGGVATRARFDPEKHGDVNISDEMRAEIGDPGKWLRVYLGSDVEISREGVQQAFVAWQDVIGMRVRIVHREDAANVILKLVALDGKGGKLAEATVGDGPGSPLVSTLCIDTAETWTPEKFLYAMIHEIGHLLGLEHINSDDAIMAPIMRLDASGKPKFTTPQAADIAVAKQAWGDPIP